MRSDRTATLEEKIAIKERQDNYRAKNIEKREEILKDYLENYEYPNGKSYFCRFHKRGLCILSPSECKFAHSADDFIFNSSMAAKINGSHKPQKKFKSPSEQNEDHQEESSQEAPIVNSKTSAIPEGRVRDQQKSIGLERTYIGLYNYQQELLARGEKFEPCYTLYELDHHRPNRVAIRNRMLKDICQSFCERLYKELDTNILQRSVIEQFFNNIGWTAYFPSIIDHQYAYEIKSKNGNMIVRLPSHEDFIKLIEENIIDIIKESNLLENLPISPSLISKHYYKDLMVRKPLEPSLYVFLKHMQFTLDEYLQGLQKSNDFICRLAQATAKSPSEFEDVIIFDTTSNEWKLFCDKLNILMVEFAEKAPLGLVRYNKFEREIFSECQLEIRRYNNNVAYIRHMIKNVALRHKIMVINLLSDVFLFSLNKFKKTHADELKSTISTMLHVNCKEKNLYMTTQFQFPPFRLYESKENVRIEPEKISSPEFLEKELDIKKVIVVNSNETLEVAKSSLCSAKYIGVDLEGNLEKDGMVELIQCSYDSKIFIFDIYALRMKTVSNPSEETSRLYTETLKLLQNIMEDPAFCKIFQDGRKDSTGLHSCLQSCLVHTFDVSGVFNLISQIDVYHKHHKLLNLEEIKHTTETTNNDHLTDDQCAQIFKELEVASRAPGLNDVLEAYNATHGLNNLKGIMKERFWSMPRGYFLQRPIDPEFLVYAAKDVEDLAEVRAKMIARLEILLQKIYGSISIEAIETLCTYLSHTYSSNGCKEMRAADSNISV